MVKSMTLSRPDRVPKTELEFGEAKKKPAVEDTKPSESALSEGDDEKPEEALPSEDEKGDDKTVVKKVKKRRPKKRPEPVKEQQPTAPETEEAEGPEETPEQPSTAPETEEAEGPEEKPEQPSTAPETAETEGPEETPGRQPDGQQPEVSHWSLTPAGRSAPDITCRQGYC